MAKHPVYYQTLAIQHEINWLKTLIQAAGVEETIEVDGKKRKITRDPKTGQFGRGGSSDEVSQDDKNGKMGPSKPGDKAYEKKDAGPIPQPLEQPKEYKPTLESKAVRQLKKSVDGLRNQVAKLPPEVTVPAKKVSQKAKEAGWAISSALDAAGETKLGKAVGKATSTIADKVDDMKEATTEKMDNLAKDVQEQMKPENLKKLGKDAADAAEAMAVGLAINMSAFAIGGAVAGTVLGVGAAAGVGIAVTSPFIAIPVILTMKDLPNYKAIAKALKAAVEKDPVKKAQKTQEANEAVAEAHKRANPYKEAFERGAKKAEARRLAEQQGG